MIFNGSRGGEKPHAYIKKLQKSDFQSALHFQDIKNFQRYPSLNDWTSVTYKTSLSCLKYNEKDNLSPPSYWQLVRNEAKDSMNSSFVWV